jgi:serine/threonine protein kinase/tetratricopeptide (TPR) repeat protein
VSRPGTNELDPTRAKGQRAPSELPDGEGLIGRVIDGRYRIDALLGRGGMGTVYRAEHVAIRRTVALKLLHSSLAGIPEVHRRFEREALAIGRIAHPNCVDVSDFGRLDDGSLFLVMEFLEGQSLGDLLDRHGRLPPARALRILRHVLRGLEHAHQAGIVHRDVKPENVVLVTHDGVPDFAKILDFGIAKILGADGGDEGVKLTQAGVAFGTPVYMSPEQAVGNPVDARADLYAASVMAFEMIAGQPPFYSDDKIEVLSMHTSRPVPRLSDIAPDVKVPSGVELVIRRGLTKRPAERYASASEYIAAIDSALVQLAIDEDVARSGGVTDTGSQPLATAAGGAALLVVPTGQVVLPGHAHGHGSGDRSSPVQRLSTIGTDATGPAPSGAFVLPGQRATTGIGWLAPTRERIRVIATKHRRRLPLIAAVAGLAVLLIVGMIVLGGDDDAAPSAPASEIADNAAGKLEQGDPAAAIKALEAAKDEIADDPQAQLQLGHAHAAKRNNVAALAAYERALALDAALAGDAAMRANLAAIANDKDGVAAVGALTISIQQGKDEGARAKLAEMASTHADMKTRNAAAARATELGLGERVDWMASYTLDLVQGDTCKIRKEAVAKLRALGDPRAVPALEKAKIKKSKPRSKVNQNACLVDDAKAAVVYLKGLAATQPAAPPQ